jgi:hypothetical protein
MLVVFLSSKYVQSLLCAEWEQGINRREKRRKKERRERREERGEREGMHQRKKVNVNTR